MNKYRLPILIAAVCLAALPACGSRSIACDAEAASDVFNDPEIKALLERSKPLDENYEPSKSPARTYFHNNKSKEAIPFFIFLDTVINKELADQPYEYRKTACKVILHYCHELASPLDAIYARPFYKKSQKGGWDIAGNFNEAFPGEDEFLNQGTIREFITMEEGKIVGFVFGIDCYTCDGCWGTCCGTWIVPKYIKEADEEMLEDLKALGLTLDSRYFYAKLPVDTAAP